MFADRFSAKSNGSFRAEWDQSGLVAWSYGTRIGYIPNGENAAYLVRQRFSVTTSKQQTWLGGACRMAGLQIVDVDSASALNEIIRHDTANLEVNR